MEIKNWPNNNLLKQKVLHNKYFRDSFEVLQTQLFLDIKLTELKTHELKREAIKYE